MIKQHTNCRESVFDFSIITFIYYRVTTYSRSQPGSHLGKKAEGKNQFHFFLGKNTVCNIIVSFLTLSREESTTTLRELDNWLLPQEVAGFENSPSH